jgi:hypothetical protein
MREYHIRGAPGDAAAAISLTRSAWRDLHVAPAHTMLKILKVGEAARRNTCCDRAAPAGMICFANATNDA